MLTFPFHHMKSPESPTTKLFNKLYKKSLLKWICLMIFDERDYDDESVGAINPYKRIVLIWSIGTSEYFSKSHFC